MRSKVSRRPSASTALDVPMAATRGNSTLSSRTVINYLSTVGSGTERLGGGREIQKIPALALKSGIASDSLTIANMGCSRQGKGRKPPFPSAHLHSLPIYKTTYPKH
jgi:hypothetical protein